MPVDHPLVEQPQERLAEGEQPHLVQHLHEESRVEQVQRRRAPRRRCTGRPAASSRDLLVPRRLVVARVRVAEEVPGRVDERVHRVRLALGRAAAASGTSSQPSPRPPPAATCPSAGSRRSRAAAQAARRRARARGRSRRSRRSGSGSPSSAAARSASRAAGSGSSPRRGRAPASHATIVRLPSGAGRPVNSPELTSTSSSVCATYAPVRRASAGRPAGRRDDLADLDAVLLGERVVALVVGGHGHDRAGAVLHQHVVGDPDRDRLAVDRVDRVAAGEDAVLLLRLSLDGGPRRGVAHVVGDPARAPAPRSAR